MRRSVFILLLVFLAGFSQAQDKTKYKTGNGDGYDASRSEVYIESIFQEEAVCEGDDALFTMQVEGSMLYSYRWYKVGATQTTLSTESFLLIKNCVRSRDNGAKYMCEVIDLSSNEMTQPWDTFRLTVLPRPEPKLNLKKDTTVCIGQTVNLSVTPNNSPDYIYTWYGDGIVGTTYTSQVTVKPEVNTRYEVTLGNGICASAPVGVQVNVVSPLVTLPADIVYTRGESVTITPLQSGSFDWYASYGLRQSNKGSFTVSMPDTLLEATVSVALRTNGCTVSDSMRIVNELARAHYFGGSQDGFVESQQNLSVSGITPILSEVCRGEDAFFSCNVGSVGTYTYQWYRLVDKKAFPIQGATTNILSIPTDDMDNAGQYYCVVHDLDTKQTKETDPATLEIIERPEVKIVTEDVAICKGTQVELKANRGADDGETFRWNGVNIQTNSTEQTITVAPTEDAIYQLVAKKGRCMITQEVKVTVNEVQVSLPGVIDILRGEEVVLGFPKETGIRYAWTVKGGSSSSGDTLKFEPKDNTVVHVTKGLGSCVASDSTQIFLKEYGVGLTKNMTKDGYTESVLPFFIKEVDCPQRLCIGDEAILNIEVQGYEVFQYTWKKRKANGEEVIVDTVKQHRIPSVTKNDAGTYFCEVKNVQNGEMRASDEVTMEVLDKPVAEIEFLNPAIGFRESCWVCAGTTVELEARKKEGWTYLWDGLGLLGDVNEPTISALPEESTDISLVVSNGSCSDVIYARVNVQNISVDIPEVLFVAEGEAFTVEPLAEVAPDAKLKWVFNNGAAVTAAKFTSTGVTQSAYLKLTMSLDGCEAYDSTRIYVRGFNTFQGGAEDGFIESNSSFLIQELRFPSIICENEDADFSVRVKGSGIYLYNWRQVGVSESLSSESVYSISKCGMDMNGQRYYCLVTDLMLGKTLSSDTLTLNIRKGPKAVINYPDRGKAYCVGSVIRIDARKTEDYKESEDVKYVYSWEGENVAKTEYNYAVDVRPTQTQVYTLKVSTENCSAYDTIQINIIDPHVSIPSVIYAEENKVLRVSAEVSNVSVGATINWWHNALFIPNKNPYVVADIEESASIVAEVVDRGCKSTDTARVYVRSARFYAGGDDDGFMESCNIPEIDPSVPTVLGCGGADSVEMRVGYTGGDPDVFQWQRFDQNLAKFVNVTESDNLSGLGTPILKIKPLTEDFYGQYRCVLTNNCGSTYSLTYKVSNVNPPKVGVHHDTLTVCEGKKDYELIMVLEEDNTLETLSYRWFRKNPITGVVIQYTPEASFNKKTYTIPEVTPEYDAVYLMEAEGVCGTVTDSVRLIVNKKVSFRIQPVDTVVCYNSSVTLNAYTQDGGICTYSLKRVEPDRNVFEGYRVTSVCKGNSGSRYTFKEITMEDAGYYVWTARSECGDSVTSRMFLITVDKPLEFVSQTVDTTVCLGSTLEMAAEAVSPDCPNSKITYTWDKLSEGRLAWQTSVVSTTVETSTEGAYVCSATNVCGTIELENPIQVGIHPELLITRHPVFNSNTSICEEQPLELDFAVNRPAVVDSIRWFRKDKTSLVEYPIYTDSVRIFGAENYALLIDSIRPEEEGLYFARVYNVCGIYETIALDIPVAKKVRFEKQIAEFFENNVVCYGDKVTLQAVVSGAPNIAYDWRKGDTFIGNGTTVEVVFDKDVTYACRAYNMCNDTKSEWAVNVVRPDTFLFSAVNLTHYCEGDEGCRLQLQGSIPHCSYLLYREETPGAKAEPVQEIKGEDALLAGGSLDFGTHPAGLYYVIAYDSEIGCHGRMPGDVTVVMDSLPRIYNTIIERPICEGELAGSIMLSGSQTAANQRFQYVLQRQKEDKKWEQFNKVIYGTGDSLHWEAIPQGLYRIEAVDRETKCFSMMNGEADLRERPNPAPGELELLRGKTLYCEGEEMDIALRIKAGEFVAGQTYTLVKDQVLTDQVKTTDSDWEKLTEGNYYVVIKNEWGCVDTTNDIQINKYPVPAQKSVQRDRIYCAEDVQEGESTAITVNAVDENIKYAFWRMGEKAPFEESFKKKNSYLTTEVALEDAMYYVIATDTSTGCSISMADTVTVQGSRLKLSHEPVTMNRADTRVRLNLTVQNAIGQLTVKWKPEIQIVDIADPLRPWVDMTDMTQNEFEVTVSDTICTKTERIYVSVEGQALTALIKDVKSGDDVDTLWVCEGSTYSLNGVVLGGKDSYSYEWAVDGVFVGNKKRLENAVATASGNLVFRVASNGRVASDTVRLEVYPAPGRDLVVDVPKTCVNPGSRFVMNMSNIKKGVTYSLEYSTNGSVYKATGASLTGGASSTASLSELFDLDKTGYYRIKATYKYGETTCNSSHNEVLVRAGVYQATLHGGGIYCERNVPDTLMVDTTVRSASYRLLYKGLKDDDYVEFDQYAGATGDGKALLALGNWPTGTYRMVAQRSAESCVDTLPGEVLIKHLDRPYPGVLLSENMEYCVPDEGEDLQVAISLEGVVSGYTYRLYQMADGNVNLLRTENPDPTETSIDFGDNFSQAGRYFSVADNGYCKDTAGYVLIGKMPTDPIYLVPVDTGYCAGETPRVSLKLYPAPAEVRYNIYPAGYGSAVAECQTFDEDTVRYTGGLNSGKYVVKMKVAACEREAGTFTVEEYELPNPVDLLAPTNVCEGTNLSMGVVESQEKIQYTLYYEEEGKDPVLKTQKFGDGKDLVLLTSDKAGIYYLSAKDTLTGCTQDLESYVLVPKPQNFDFFATDTAYCAFDDESGTQLALSGTQANVEYILQQYNEEEGAYVDVWPSATIMGLGMNIPVYFNGMYRAGKYRVRTTTCSGFFIGNELEIEEIALPDGNLAVELGGNGCVDSTMHVIIKETEDKVKYSLKMDTLSFALQTGDGSDKQWTVNKAAKGVYQIYAIRENERGFSCSVRMNREINVETLPLMQALSGESAICQYTTTTLRLSAAESDVTYGLYYAGDATKAVDGTANLVNVIFEDVNPGTYYAVASRGDCKHLSPVYTLDSLLVPDIKKVSVDYTDCIEQGSGQITIDDLQDTLTYFLIHPNGKEEVCNRTVVTKKTFDKLEIGDYYIRVSDLTTGCFSLMDTISLNNAVPAGDTLAGPFDYCEGSGGSKLRLAHSSMYIVYSVVNAAGDTLETLYGGVSNTSFKKYYKEGNYTMVAERQGPYGGCQRTQEFEVKKRVLPALTETLALKETGALCEGGEYHISVVDAQEDVAYILNLGKTAIDTIYGIGTIEFAAVSKAGDYTVLPKNGGVCGTTPLDTLIHINTLPTEIVVEQPCTYCNPADAEDEAGASLKIFNTVNKTRYVLNNGTQDVDTLIGNYMEAYQEFAKMPAGNYVIRAIDTVTKCSAQVGEGEIKKFIAPVRFVCGWDSVRCATKAPVGLANSQTGIDYYLHRDGRQVAGPLAGEDDTLLSFDDQTEPGIYQILAKSPEGCSVYMKDSVIVYPPLREDTLMVRGSYCEKGASDITFRLRYQSLYWKYFILSDKHVASDTLEGSESTLIWSEVGGKDIRAGKYSLMAMNPCGDLFKMDSVVIDTNNLPDRYAIKEGDFTLCAGDSGTITLSGSQTIVEYDLVHRSSEGVVKQVATRSGTGEELVLASVEEEGTYTVIGRMKATGCSDTIATVKVNLIDGIEDPGVNADNLCLTEHPGEMLQVSLRKTSDYISYYLQRATAKDTVLVDSIKFGNKDDFGRTQFQGQNKPGVYSVIAQGPTCVKTFMAAMAGEYAKDQKLVPDGVAAICGGNSKEISLQGSESGVLYEVYKITKVHLDADTLSVNIVATGTGEAITLGELTEPGLYMVKANNGCIRQMSDTLRLNVQQSYKIELGPGYTLCGANDSTHITIFGRTNPAENAHYLIYEPGATNYAEAMSAGNQQASISSKKWFKKPGYYRVEGIDASGCPEVDSVKITVLPLPNVYPVRLRGNKYLCESLSKKDIVVDGAQQGVDYHLYRVVNGGEPKAVTMKSTQPNDDEIVFTVYEEGTYYVVGQYNDKGAKSCPVRMDGEIELTPVQVNQYVLESVRDIYCERPSEKERGEVRLLNSDKNVTYQLYQDGIACGEPQQSENGGDVLVWKGLTGGVPALSAELAAKPIKYTVKATDLLTGCEVDMSGTVNVIGERTIVFSERQLQDAVPTCIGKRLNMVVLAYGGTISYQWKKGADMLAGATKYFYTKDSVGTNDIGVYSCEMTNTCGTVVTPNIEVRPAMLLTTSATGMDTTAVCNLKAGGSAEVRLHSRVNNADAWEWYKDGKLLEGEIFSGLDVVVSRESGAGKYVCRASNACGALLDTCLVQVDSTPRVELVKPLHKDTLCEGSAWQLEVKATSPIYWVRGTQKLEDRTATTLHIDSIQASDGGTYFVVSDNHCGQRKEEVGSLVVDRPVNIISEHDWFSICRQKKEFPYLFIQTDPKERVSYRWEDRKGKVLGRANELTNIDLNVYTGLVDTFRVYYGNRCGEKYKDIMLQTNDFIQFQQPPTEIAVCVTEQLPDTVLSVKVMNAQSVSYKWFKQTTFTSARDSVGNTESINIRLDNSKYAGYYYCYIANQCVDTVSIMSSIRIDTIPEVFVTLPKTDTLCSGSEMKLKVSGRAGNGSLTYAWYVKKKGQEAKQVAMASYFGLSQSEYSCFVDTTYNDALIWCDVFTACMRPAADTMRLTVLPAPRVEMNVRSAWACEKENNEVYVSLRNGGGQPWKYKYSMNGKEDATIRTVNGETDTLQVSEAGAYRVYWLADANCTLNGKELAVTEYKQLARSNFSVEAVDYYDETVCPNTEITLKVSITGGVRGPWNLGVYRTSDGELASELGFENMMYTMDSVYTQTFKVQKTESYFVRVKNVYEQQACDAQALIKSVDIHVFDRPEMTINDLTAEERVLSQCSNVSLQKLFNAQPEQGGWYVIDNQQLAGDYILEPDREKYTVGYRIYQNNCVFDGYNLGELEFRPRPELNMSISKDALCGLSENSIVKFTANGEFPIKLVYRVLDLHKDGKTSLVSTVDHTLTAALSALNVRFYYDENLAGKIIEVLRVEDKFKCIAEELDIYRDTINFVVRPEYAVSTKVGDMDWVETMDETYRIRKGDSVAVRVELKQGNIPWMVHFGEPMNGNTFQRWNILTETFDTAIYKAGLYEVSVEDRHCATSLFEDKPHITVSVVDTAFVSLKALLQGPWDASAGKMVSSVLDNINKHGLSAWPNVGSRKIIDWVEVELWNDATEEFWDSQRCLLLDDGTIVDEKGSTSLKLIGKTSTMRFRVAVRPRNHLAVWSKPIDLSATTLAKPYKLDFTNPDHLYTEPGETANKYVYMDVKGKAFLYGGEVNTNRLITSFDPNRITREVLSIDEKDGKGALLLDINYNGKIEWPGYNVKINGSATEYLDWAIMYKNRLRFSIVPEREINW